MAAGINKVILIGHLGNDPETRYTQQGTAVANFNIATSEAWTDRQGTRQEKTEWHRIVVWQKLAELCAQYLGKGRQVYIEGRLQTRQWEDKSGNKRYTTEVVASTVQFLGKPGETNTQVGAPKDDFADNAPIQAPEEAPLDEDIPF